MTDKKQSAVARRLAKLNDAVIIQNETTTNQLISQQVNTNTLGISNLNSEVYSLQNQNNNLASSLQFQLDDTQPTSLMARVIDLENNPSGGGGGIDPTDPTQPILIVDNFLIQPNGDPDGTFPSPYIYPAANTTVLNTNGLNILNTESEVDHNGIIIARLTSGNNFPVTLTLGQRDTSDICRLVDLNSLYFILKTPNTLEHSIRIGLMDNFANSPSAEEIVFERLVGEANISVVTRTGGTQTKTTTGIAYTTNTWYTFKLARTSSNTVDFTVNTTLINQTTNIPTGFLNVGIQVVGNNNSDDEDFKLDFFSLKLGDVTPVSNGQELNELHDVNITSIANNDVLQWDSTDNRWENRSIATAGIASATHTHTYDQVNNVQASRLIGRWTSAGTGSLQEITLGRGFKLSTAGELSTNMGQVVDVVTTITAGNGLIGGGDLSQNRSLSVNFAANGEVSSSKAVRADDSRLNNIPSGGGLFDIDGGDSGTYTGTPILDGGGA
jgi:hypothetical protein